MNNYINVRLETSNHYKEKNDIKHNLGTVNKKSNSTESNFLDYEETNYKFGNSPFEKFKEWRGEHEKRFIENRFRVVNGKKVLRNEKLQNHNSTLLGGIITFSEAINKNLGVEYSKEEYEKSCIEAVEKIADEMETEILYVSFHYKEKTPHCHFHLKNFDNEGKSIFHKHKKKEQLSKFQDLAFSSLKSLGMERGQSKEITNKNHQTTKAYYAKLYKETQDDLRTQVKLLKEKRKEVSSLDISIEEKKILQDEISGEQKVFRKLDKILAKAKNGAITEEEQKAFLEEMPIFGKYLTVEKKKEFIELVEKSVVKKSQTDLK